MAPFCHGACPVSSMDLLLRPTGPLPGHPARPLRLAVRVALSALLAVASAHAALAQPVAGPAQLGMTLAELQSAYPSLQRLARPVVAPRGLRGQWRLTDTVVAGLPFETIFFFQGPRVQRIEQVRAEEAQPCAPQDEFAAVVNATGLGFGGGQGGFGASGMDAFGTAGGADVSAHLQISGGSCAIRVVYKPTVLKDGSAL